MLAKFHEVAMILTKLEDIFLFYRVQTRAPDAVLRTNAIKFVSEVLDTTNFQNLSNMMKLRLKFFERHRFFF